MIRPALAVLLLYAQTQAPLPAPSASLAPAPPPTSQTPTKPDLSGTWTLDADISVDLSRVNLDPSANREGSQQRNRQGRFGGFGRGGGFGGSRQRAQTPRLTQEEQMRLKAMTDALKLGWTKLVLSLHEPSFVVNDSRDRTLFFQTDGSTVDNHVGDATLPSVTRWDGDRLVTEWPLGSDITVVYSFALLTNGRQLVVRVNRKNGQDVRPFDPDVRLVYKRTSS